MVIINDNTTQVEMTMYNYTSLEQYNSKN